MRESVQSTPDAAAPDAYEPGAGLEISAPTLDDVQWIRLCVPAGTKTTAAARSWIEGWDGIVSGEVWYDAEADALWSGTATHDNFNQRVFYDLDYITICFTHSSPSGETMAGLQPGETGYVILARFENSGWEFRNGVV